MLSNPSPKKRRSLIKTLRWVKEEEVWNHWKKVEGVPDELINWENEVRSKLPYILAWFRCKVEKDDVDKIYVISSDEWRGLAQSFKLADVVKSLETPRLNSLARSILEKKKVYEQNLNALDRVFILVSPTVTGNYTIIEGNKRASALLSLKKLVGSQIYLGVSPKIRDYFWARLTPR